MTTPTDVDTVALALHEHDHSNSGSICLNFHDEHLTAAQPGSPQRASDADDCPHCDPHHGNPSVKSWGVLVGPRRDSDGQPMYLYVQPSNGAHVAESDATWLWELIRDEPQLRKLRAEVEQLTRERDSLARRCSMRFEANQRLTRQLAEMRDLHAAATNQWANAEADLAAARAERDEARTKLARLVAAAKFAAGDPLNPQALAALRTMLGQEVSA